MSFFLAFSSSSWSLSALFLLEVVGPTCSPLPSQPATSANVNRYHSCYTSMSQADCPSICQAGCPQSIFPYTQTHTHTETPTPTPTPTATDSCIYLQSQILGAHLVPWHGAHCTHTPRCHYPHTPRCALCYDSTCLPVRDASFQTISILYRINSALIAP